MQNDAFVELVWREGQRLYRDMPWRQDTRPYYVLVSELMLQQTQVARVIPKFKAFIARFPDERALAGASLADVLQLWQGLGYNRRAKYLHESANIIVHQYDGVFPTDPDVIIGLPGVGKNTLGAIQAYAFNRPAIFIETNIRTVYIHHFFHDRFDVDDAHIRDLLAATIDKSQPREWYWALMDYGSWLKGQGIRNIDQSRHYKKQSPLQGSVRQVRGQIIRVLGERAMSEEHLRRAVNADERFTSALKGLMKDGLITLSDSRYHLTK